MNQPLVFLHDIPGFFIGRDAERKRVAALGMVSVPRVSIVVRKTYGQAYFNMGGGGYADTAEMSFMNPATGVNVVHGAELARLPAEARAARRRPSGSPTPCPTARRAGTSCRT